MEVNLVKPLTPLPNGVIVIVGAKSGNFDNEIMTHPRVVIWDSQNTHWTNKDLPSNTKAVFMTRFIGHSEYNRILTEARKKQIPLFNPEGTGSIARQVKQLLGLEKQVPTVKEEVTTQKETEMVEQKSQGKLKPLIPFVNLNIGNVENARILMVKALELGIETTEGSLGQMVSTMRRKQAGAIGVPRSIRQKVDVSVEILDGMIKELQDMRQFLIDTVEENNSLRGKLAKFRKVFEE